MTLLTLLVGLAFADSIVCDAVRDSTLHYEEWSKSGGAHPGPETVMQSWSWTLDDKVLYSAAQTYGGGDVQAQGDLDWSWDMGTRAHQSRTPRKGMAPEVTTIYLATVTVWTRSGKALSDKDPASKATVRMKCTYIQQFGVP